MRNKQTKQSEVTRKGAVEVDEKDLDSAAGGAGLTYSKIQLEYGRVSPQGFTGAGGKTGDGG